jgi:VPDSG-CTERM motif
MKIKNTLLTMAASCGLLAGTTGVQAHTISIGTFNAGAPGSVTIAMGTYTAGHGTVQAEGAITLISGPGIPPSVGPVSFGGLTTVKPAQLIDSGPTQNNFFTDGTGNPGYSALVNTTVAQVGVIANWQLATFTGLAAGTYTYQITGMNTVDWANYGTGDANWTGTLVIPGSSVTPGGVPDSGSSIALLGLALVGMAGLKRKFAV